MDTQPLFKKYICVLIFVLTGTSPYVLASVDALPSTNPDHFFQWNKSSFDSFFVNGEADLSQYKKIVLFPATFDRLELSKHANHELVESWQRSSWSEMDRICNQFDVFAKRQFTSSPAISLTNQGADDVLALEFRLMEFLPTTTRYTDADRGTAADSYALGNLGAIKVQAVLANAKSGELIAVIEDNIPLNSDIAFLKENRVAHNRIWRQAFKSWVNHLHDDLIALQSP